MRAIYLDDSVCATLATQDNMITSDPLFIVFQKQRLYGFETKDRDLPIAWLNAEGDYEEADAEESAMLEDEYQRYPEEPKGWVRTAYMDINEFVTACLTRAAAERYIEENSHNLNRPFIFCDSLYRNREMRAIRRAILESFAPVVNNGSSTIIR